MAETLATAWMKTQTRFIRGVEIWVPNADGRYLDLESGLYGDLDWFGRISRGMRFGAGEGLPGQAATAGHPLVVKNLANSYFRRGDAAMTEGLTCAVGVPLFGKAGITAVMVLLCGDSTYHAGAIELWTQAPGANVLSLADGYFGHSDAFASHAGGTTFERGVGVPGMAWETGRPVVLTDLSAGGGFVRSEVAKWAELDRAIGIPVGSGGGAAAWVMTFLSSRRSPIANRVEVWLPGDDGSLTYARGFCESGLSLAEQHDGVSLSAGDGACAKAAKTQRPIVVEDLSRASDHTARAAVAGGLTSQVAMPVLVGGELRAVLAWYL